jgi:hypothetical protein
MQVLCKLPFLQSLQVMISTCHVQRQVVIPRWVVIVRHIKYFHAKLFATVHPHCRILHVWMCYCKSFLQQHTHNAGYSFGLVRS